MEAEGQTCPGDQSQLLAGGSGETPMSFSMWKQTLLLLSRHCNRWCHVNISKVVIDIKKLIHLHLFLFPCIAPQGPVGFLLSFNPNQFSSL